ncbi:hypothetical protein ACVINI_000144 [Rhizobium beringeri]
MCRDYTMTGESAMHENAAGACGNRHVKGPEYDLRTVDIACVRRPPHLPRRRSLAVGDKANYSGRSVPSSPCGTKRAVGMMVSGGKVSLGLRENIMRCSLALEMKKG